MGKLKKYVGFMGSDRFEFEAKNTQDAFYKTARLFIAKYNLPGRIKPNLLVPDAHCFVLPDYVSPISSEELVEFALRRSGNGTNS